MRPPRWMAAASVAALLAACSASPDASTAPEPTARPSTSTPSPSSTSTSDADDSADPPPLAANDALDGLTGRQLDGGTFDGSAVTGDVVVWFWAPW